MSSVLTPTAIRTFVRRSLGDPVVEVELTDEQIDEMANQALGIYGTAKPVEILGTFNVIAGVQKYTLTKAQTERGITKVMTPPPLRMSTSLDQFDIFSYHTFTPNLSPGGYSLERAYWDLVKAVAGQMEDWEFVKDHANGGGDLYITPVPSKSFVCSYYFVKDPTFSEVPATDDDWIFEYSLAMCMEVLGRIRSKFQGVQGTETTIDMDGELLRNEGLEKRRELEEYINGRGDITPPIIG